MLVFLARGVFVSAVELGIWVGGVGGGGGGEGAELLCQDKLKPQIDTTLKKSI